jgi:hypothetical protein
MLWPMSRLLAAQWSAAIFNLKISKIACPPPPWISHRPTNTHPRQFIEGPNHFNGLPDWL